MKHHCTLFLLAASCALGAAACADGDTTDDETVGQVSAAVSQDTIPPTFDCVSPGDCLLTSPVIATAGPGQLTARIHVLDGPAGFQAGTFTLKSPSGQYAFLQLQPQASQGTPQDGLFEGSTTIPQFAEAGTWSVEMLSLLDGVGNLAQPSPAELAAGGFPTTFVVQSVTDLDAPGFDCSQPGECLLTQSVDVTSGPAQVTVRVRVTDLSAGHKLGGIALKSPSGHYRFVQLPPTPLSGTLQNGLFEGSGTIPQFAEAGTWSVEMLSLVDNAGNLGQWLTPALSVASFPTSLSVDSDPDVMAPTFTCAQPGGPVFTTIDTTSGSVNVWAEIWAFDDKAGVDGATLSITGPSGQPMSMSLGGPLGGTSLAGRFGGSISVPQFSELGIWTITGLGLLDKAGNHHAYTLADLENAGCITALINCHTGDTCNDANACTTGETCSATGQCGGAAIVNCDDGNACTADSCNPASGCAHTPLSCDDGNPCTADLCSPAIGCLHNPTTAACDDGNPCTAGDACLAGFCWGPPASCDDGNACTADTCDPAVGCGHAPASGPCEDGNPCTSDDQCAAGQCQPGQPTVCDDGEECTNDSCDAAVGCLFANRTGSCGGPASGCASGGACFGGHCTVGTVCGDGTCCQEGGETPCSCPQDCSNPPGVPDCGNGCCGAGEDACSCPQDCGASPNDGQCCGNETACNSDDCGANACGDGCCGAGETPCGCPQDCGAQCGDGCCSATEDACDCPADCQSQPDDGLCCGAEDACNSGDCGPDTCGNGCCGPSETACGCPQDCGAVCGDDCCTGAENACSCPGDCQPQPDDGLCCGAEDACNSGDCGPDTCGNGCCGAQETTCNCPADCGQAVCGDGQCAPCGEDECSCPADCGGAADRCANGCASTCGDGCCGTNGSGAQETACTCPGDCAPACGDGCCNGGETSCSCPADCGVAQCGDGACDACAGETPCGCPADCSSDGDGECCGGEDACSSSDCGPPALNNGLCEACNGETTCNAPGDCAPVCGDGCCNGPESACTCPLDCAAQCGNGTCDACAGETPCGCPADCGALDDGVCCGGEDACSTEDCGKPAKNNGLCEECNGEDSCSSPEDCAPVCGDGCCNGPETVCTCPDDCGNKPVCGNGSCDSCWGEDACSCAADCGGADACGDGLCCGGEDACSCAADCGGVVHGDSLCCANETACDEPACGPVVPGDGLCCGGESACTGEAACGAGTCGDGCCGPGEDACSCAADCGSQITCVTIRRGMNGDVADSCLLYDSPWTAAGASSAINIGAVGTGKEYRPLFRFDLTSLPPSAHVFSATLILNPALAPPLQTGQVHRVFAPWDEATVTEANFGDPNNFDWFSSGSFSMGTGATTTVDLTALVQSWVDKSKPNYGILLRSTSGPIRKLYTSEHLNTKARPRLLVCHAECAP